LKILKSMKIIIAILKLKEVSIRFRNFNKNNKSCYLEIYKYFTKSHNRYKIFKNKTLGVGLIDINNFINFEDYNNSINGKNSAAYYMRKANKRGYRFIEINKNDFVEEIYRINTSVEIRQGQKMSKQYLEKIISYDKVPCFKYFGVVDKNNKLFAYCDIAFLGDFISINRLLGHKKYLNEGIMYLMIIELNKLIFEKYKQIGYKYIMYDTFFGASDGLKKFKEKLGFKPYKVKWIWEN